MIGSIYPEKMVFVENTLRTIRANEVIEWMCRPVAGSSDLKNKECPEKSGHSTLVPHSGMSSNRFKEDLQRLYGLKMFIINL